MKLKDAKYFGIKLSPHRIKNDKGQLIVTGCEFARTGKQKYHSSELGIEDKDEFIYLDRPVEEVSDPKTVASFEGAPVTLDHPDDDVKVGVNYNELAKGFAKDVKYVAINDKEGYLQADFVITDADLIKKIENNEINELSAGYNCDVDENDWVQRHIRGNHIAVVEQARAGHQARLLDKKYKSTSKSQKTLKIGDSVVKIVDSYSYELENLDGTKTRYTDYYTEGSTGKKKYVTTLKDEANPKNVILVKVDGKWKTWGGTNKDKLEEDSRYEKLVKKYGKENLKFVPNKELDKAKAVKDSKESDARVLKALESLLPEFKKLDEKYAGLVAMQKKYWNSWDGYSKAIRSGELSKDKLSKMQAQSVKANKDYLELVKKWNKLCMQTMRRGREDWMPKGVATGIKGDEEIHFPEDHYYGNTSVEKFSYMLNEINKALANYSKGTGASNWRVKSEDSKVEDSDKIYKIDGVEYILSKDGYGNYKLDEKKTKNRVADWDSYKEAMKDINKWIKQNKITDSKKVEDAESREELKKEIEALLKREGNTSDVRLKAERCGFKIENGKVVEDEDIKAKADRVTKKKTKDSIDSEEEDIYTRRQEIDDNLQDLFDDSYFDISGFANGNDSTEGSIYVIDYNPYKDEGAITYAEDRADEDYDDEEFIDLACEYLEEKVRARLRKANLYGEEGPIDSIDVGAVDWSGEEEFPINVHLYCNGVTK